MHLTKFRSQPIYVYKVNTVSGTVLLGYIIDVVIVCATVLVIDICMRWVVGVDILAG